MNEAPTVMNEAPTVMNEAPTVMPTGSIFLIAVGAMLYFAVNGVNLGAVGVILMIVGALGLVVSLLMLGMSAVAFNGPPSERAPRPLGEPSCTKRRAEPSRPDPILKARSQP